MRLRLALIAVVAVLAAPGPPAADAEARSPQVICLLEWGGQPTGAYRYRPHQCDLHERGVLPAAHVNITVAKKLRWLHWGASSATAKGKLGVSTYGLAPIKLRLFHPRTLCGHTVFTEMKVSGRIPYGGKPHRFSYRKKIDNCLR